MRTLRYRGNSYASPDPVNESPRPGSRSYRWVKYDIETTTNKVVPMQQRKRAETNHGLAA